jgi:negative regulator of flagellin synthesis FlgM
VHVERSELLLGRIEQALQAAPIVDAGRVSAIKDAIASGAYEIDPAIVAAKILQLERELS